MEMIGLNHSYAKVKGALLLVLVAIGGALGNMLIFAEDYFDLQKAIICAAIFIILVFVYVHLEHIDPEVEAIKQKLGPVIKNMGPDEELDLLPDEGPNPPS